MRVHSLVSSFGSQSLRGSLSIQCLKAILGVCGICICADEMGLGKTVELLGCILANPNKKALKLDSVKAAKMVQAKLDSRKCDRVDCTCGATHEDPSYDGSWIQCDICDAWQHALCVGYIAPPDVEANLQRIAAQGLQPNKRSDNKMQLGVTISPDLKHRCLFTVMQVSLILQKDINSRISVQFRS